MVAPPSIRRYVWGCGWSGRVEKGVTTLFFEVSAVYYPYQLTLTHMKKVAIVTGGSHGIGFGIAERLVADGYRVVLANRNKDAGLAAAKRLGRAALFVPCDVREEKDAKRVVAATVRMWGRIDAVVNNAGIALVEEGVGSLDMKKYDEIMDTNVRGTVVMTKHAWKSLVKTAGTIVNISSVAGLMPEYDVAVYSASKAAVIMLTKSWAVQGAEKNVRVNAVCPGPVTTGISDKFFQNRTEYTDYFVKRVPMQRIGKVSEVANVVSFLVSNQASYVTGAVWSVDGGMALGPKLE